MRIRQFRFRASLLLGPLLLALPACEKAPLQPFAPALRTVSAGADHACGVTHAGAAYCWGDNTYGALGAGTISLTPVTTPVAVVGGLSFATVSAGWGFTCGVTTAGVGYCWGANGGGALGIGRADTIPHPTPVPVVGGLTFAMIDAGAAHACSVTTRGVAYCWGFNQFGELGIGAADTIPHPAPVVVSSGLTYTAVSAGVFHTCGVTTGGAAYCWGLNQFGEVGDGSMTRRAAPVAVTGGLTFATVGARWYHTCGVTTGNEAYCWGHGGNGELGNDSLGSSSSPVAVAGGLAFSVVSAGGFHTCGVTTDGVGYCWGGSGGGLLGTTASSPVCYISPEGPVSCSTVPVPVAGGLTFATVSSGEVYTCGVTTGGTGYCWGDNSGGQLGDGSLTSRTTPVAVASR